MADRWSNPSGTRFRVWPGSSDSYDHVELTANWDTLDAIIGIPTGGDWPPTEGIGGGLWYEIHKAKNSAIPVGMALPWFRANEDMDVPDGWVVADGRVLQASEHDIPNVSGTFAVPDLRGKFVIGANADATIGSAGVAATDALVDSATGAPGPGGTGGSNHVALTKEQMPSHNHSGSLTGWSPQIWTWYQDTTPAIHHASTGNYGVNRVGAGCSSSQGDGGFVYGQHQHTVSLTAEGSGAPHENRPRYIGLIWIVKVKNNS